MNDTCRLCEKSSKLANSHILPKSIFNWMKETSATGYLRSSQKVDVPQQDGIKTPFLCLECEKQFSTYEKYFKEKIFLPLHDKKDSVPYNNGLLKFSASLAWRVLKYTIEQKNIEHLTKRQLEKCDSALKAWKDYLFNKKDSPGIFELHLYNFIGHVSSSGDLPDNIHRYLHRSISFNLYASNSIAFIYIKLPGFIIIGYITLPNDIKEFRATRIKVVHGMIEPMRYMAPMYIWDLIKQEALKSAEYQNSISKKQQLKIDDKYQNNIQKASQSKTVQAILKDRLKSENKDKG
ncbi:TPA: hypothetical protein I8669_002716 [Legionella pneumophila]|nr:hypothetical protein [Legionella pneumophila]